jgi:hypothetical protein
VLRGVHPRFRNAPLGAPHGIAPANSVMPNHGARAVPLLHNAIWVGYAGIKVIGAVPTLVLEMS